MRMKQNILLELKFKKMALNKEKIIMQPKVYIKKL